MEQAEVWSTLMKKAYDDMGPGSWEEWQELIFDTRPMNGFQFYVDRFQQSIHDYYKRMFRAGLPAHLHPKMFPFAPDDIWYYEI